MGRVALAVVLIAGCASAHDGEGDAGADTSVHSVPDADPTDAWADDPDAWAVDPSDIALFETAWRASCTRLVQCMSGYAFYRPFYPWCQGDLWADHEERLRTGALRVDRASAQACIDTLAMLPDCDVRAGTLTEIPTAIGDLEIRAEQACAHVFVTETARCGGVECMPQSHCTIDTACAEHCAPLMARGEACDAQSCERGLICIEGSCRVACSRAYCRTLGLDTCAGQTCIRGGRLGETCGNAAPCFEGVCADGRCVTPAEYGGACTSVPCALFWICRAGTCTSTYEADAYCYHSFDCPPGQYCRQDPVTFHGTCSDDPIGSACQNVGDRPYVFVDPDECPVGTTCIDRLCGIPTPAGAPCTTGGQCADGTSCVDGTCTTYVMPWEPCGPDAICPAPFTCEAGRCTRASSCVP